MASKYNTNLFNPEIHSQGMDALDQLRIAHGETDMFSIDALSVSRHVLGIVCQYQPEDSIESTIVGYNGITVDYEDGFIEVGGLYVAPSHRGKGLTTLMKAHLYDQIRLRSETHGIKKVIVFANGNSSHINRNHGFAEIDHCEVPEKAFNLCSNCNNFESVNQELQAGDSPRCCDTILAIDVESLPHLNSVNAK